MARRLVQWIGLACLLISVTLFASGRCRAFIAQGQAADQFAHDFLTTMAGAQELHRRASGRFGTVSELAAGGYFGNRFDGLDRIQLEGFDVVSLGSSTPDQFAWRAAPKWWLWGRASHWYVDERLVLQSRLLGEAGPDSTPVGAVDIRWSPSHHAP